MLCIQSETYIYMCIYTRRSVRWYCYVITGKFVFIDYIFYYTAINWNNIGIVTAIIDNGLVIPSVTDSPPANEWIITELYTIVYVFYTLFLFLCVCFCFFSNFISCWSMLSLLSTVLFSIYIVCFVVVFPLIEILTKFYLNTYLVLFRPTYFQTNWV